jgi:hypothetical protein
MASLLNNASLLLNPAGSVISYKEDKIYSVIPRNGAGDFTFSGGDGGTRVNQQGYIEQTPFNLFQYSNAFNTSPWSMAVTGGQTGKDGAANAWLLTKAGATTSDLYNALTTDGVQTFSIYVKKESSKGIKIYNFGTVNNFVTINIQTGVNLAQSGAGVISYKAVEYNASWWRVQVTMNCTNGKWYIYVTDGAGTQIQSSITIQDAQLVVGSDPKPYQPTTDRLNYPRITYQNGRGALLSEPQRTNVNTYSQDFTNAVWSKFSVTVTGSAAISPDGTMNASKLVLTSTSGELATSAPVSNGYTTIFAKAGNVGRFSLYRGNTSFGTEFNLYNGTVISGVGTIEPYKDGWYRIGVKMDANRSINPYFSSGYTVGDFVYIWGAQSEEGSFPTSYIPTTSATVTRPRDTTENSSASSVIGQTEGVLYTDFNWDILKGAVDFLVLTISNGTTANNVFLDIFNDTVIFGVDNSSSRVVQIQSSTITTGRHKMAGGYKNNDFVLYLDGKQIGTDTVGAVPACSVVDVGLWANGSFPFAGNLNTIGLFNTRLTNTQLQELTTVRSGSGGNISYYGPYTIHTFTGSATFTPSFNGEVEVLVVAGGGSGAAGWGNGGGMGGGGAGGLLYASSFGVSQGTGITVTIGAGGAGTTGTTQSGKNGTLRGNPGSNTIFGGLTAIGGGGGAGDGATANTIKGGSGGGGGYQAILTGGIGTPGQGNNGGNHSNINGFPGNYCGGGGGGAGAVGTPGTTAGGNGGVGLPYSISGFSTYYAGGGGGGTYTTTGPGGAGIGGLGGGGNGGLGTTNPGQNGIAGVNFTGGAGGAGGCPASSPNIGGNGGAGGSGIVIVRYLT